MDLMRELVTNIALIKCTLKSNEYFVEKYANDSKELIEKVAMNNNTMREYLKEIDIILHKMLD